MTLFSSVVSILLTVIIAVGLWCAVTLGMSDWHQQQANQYLRQMHQQSDFSETTYTVVLTHAVKARDWNNSNANAWQLEGDMRYWLWLIGDDVAHYQLSEELQLAEHALRNALEYRPNWPQTYASLALLYSHTPELDDSFFAAFTRGYQLGQFERQAGLSLLYIGLDNWSRLPESFQQQTAALLDASIQQKSNNTQVLRLKLIETDLLNTLCLLVSNNLRSQQVCAGSSGFTDKEFDR